MRSADPRRIKRRHGNPAHATGESINNAYSDQAGAMKISNVGHKLQPLPTSDGSGTTAANAAAVKVGMGCSLALYNNNAALATATFGDASVASQAAGAVQAGTKSVGIPLKPNEWTYLNSWNHEWLITSAATVLVFIIDDSTHASEQK
jgi:hypothetical protein